MPCHACQENGKRGWKWGRSGKCYTGPGARAKCERQGRAAFAGGYRGHVAIPILGLVIWLALVGVGIWLH
jgi:hypothetical protein